MGVVSVGRGARRSAEKRNGTVLFATPFAARSFPGAEEDWRFRSHWQREGGEVPLGPTARREGSAHVGGFDVHASVESSRAGFQAQSVEAKANRGASDSVLTDNHPPNCYDTDLASI
jgi:hypothetical protein